MQGDSPRPLANAALLLIPQTTSLVNLLIISGAGAILANRIFSMDSGFFFLPRLALRKAARWFSLRLLLRRDLESFNVCS